MAAVHQGAATLSRPQGYPAVAGRSLRRWISLLAALPLAILVAWMAGGEGWSHRSVPALLLWLACWRWALACLGDLLPVQLYWDGAAWWLRWQSASPPRRQLVSVAVLDLRVAVDGQRWLLLRLRLDGRRPARWLVLDRSANPVAWLEVRRCLYSTAS